MYHVTIQKKFANPKRAFHNAPPSIGLFFFLLVKRRCEKCGGISYTIFFFSLSLSLYTPTHVSVFLIQRRRVKRDVLYWLPIIRRLQHYKARNVVTSVGVVKDFCQSKLTWNILNYKRYICHNLLLILFDVLPTNFIKKTHTADDAKA